jgi:flavin reductase (DIM6/NTAB) family NADH-FMN oxidoreductase RutF
MNSIDNKLKEAMQSFAQNVTVISSVFDGMPHAMVASSATSVSMAPPSMLVCINRSITMHKVMLCQSTFAINLLSFDHIDIANRCSGGAEGEERFEEGDWGFVEGGLPILRDSVTTIICERDKAIEYGSHTIFIGIVKDVLNSSREDTLLYHSRGYKGL